MLMPQQIQQWHDSDTKLWNAAIAASDLLLPPPHQDDSAHNIQSQFLQMHQGIDDHSRQTSTASFHLPSSTVDIAHISINYL